MNTKERRNGDGTGFWGETRHGKHPDDFTVDRAEPSDAETRIYGPVMMSIRVNSS